MKLRSNLFLAVCVLATAVLLRPSFALGESCSSWLCSASGLHGQSAFDEIARFESEESQRILRDNKDIDANILRRLTEFQQSVAATSYKETLNLCVAYRLSHGYPVSHHNLDHLPGSLAAWSRIAAEGLYHPVDAVIGLKKDYLEITETGVWDFSSWFRSIYTLKFVTSSGFLYGAAHCLNTLNAREIQAFAASIMRVDVAGSTAGELALGWTIGKVLWLTVGRWALQPLRSAFTKWERARIKPALIISVGALATLLGDQYYCLQALRKITTEEITRLFAEAASGAQMERHRRIQNVIRVGRAYGDVQFNCRTKDGEAVNDSSSCKLALREFVDTVKSTGMRRELAQYERDLEATRQEGDKDAARTVVHCGMDQSSVQGSVGTLKNLEQIYKMTLSVLIPVVREQAPN